jgi:hypothetical protein
MVHCPHCGFTAERGSECPRCFAELAPEQRTAPLAGADPAVDPGAWVTVARFGNAAEAGYFSHELLRALECEPRLEWKDDFDGVHGFWRTSYELAVPESYAERAAACLRDMLDGAWDDAPLSDPSATLDRDASDTLPGEPRSIAAAGTAPSGINWVPIVLTLAAGSFVLWAGKKMHVQRRPAVPREQQRFDLWDTLARHQGEWYQPAGDGPGLRQLVIQPATGTALLREDVDGDGTVDREQQFALPR